MLAQNFKTPAELGIDDHEFEALVKVLGMLERGEIEERHFSMSKVMANTDCGTVACILGHCRIIGGDHLLNTFRPGFPWPLIKLFMYGDDRRFKVTREQGAMGLRNYLTSGEPHWDEVLGE